MNADVDGVCVWQASSTVRRGLRDRVRWSFSRVTGVLKRSADEVEHPEHAANTKRLGAVRDLTRKCVLVQTFLTPTLSSTAQYRRRVLQHGGEYVTLNASKVSSLYKGGEYLVLFL